MATIFIYYIVRINVVMPSDGNPVLHYYNCMLFYHVTVCIIILALYIAQNIKKYNFMAINYWLQTLQNNQ